MALFARDDLCCLGTKRKLRTNLILAMTGQRVVMLCNSGLIGFVTWVTVYPRTPTNGPDNCTDRNTGGALLSPKGEDRKSCQESTEQHSVSVRTFALPS